MRITKRQLRRIIKEEMHKSNKMQTIEVDWAGDLNDLKRLPAGLSARVTSMRGPGGGNPVVEITGNRESLKRWYVSSFGDGMSSFDTDFEEFYPAS